MKEGNEICLVASKGGSPTNPSWYHNLQANPNCEIRIGRNKYTAVAREVYSDDRDDCWSNMAYMNKGGYSK